MAQHDRKPHNAPAGRSAPRLWEYDILTIRPGDHGVLAKAGAEGWEAFAAHPTSLPNPDYVTAEKIRQATLARAEFAEPNLYPPTISATQVLLKRPLP